MELWLPFFELLNGKRERTTWSKDPNEIKGIDAFDWKAFPQALIVSNGEFRCNTIDDRITKVKELLEYIK